jgi:hypothetical protein
MKKTLMMAAVLFVLAGCGERKAGTPAADTAGMAPAMSDTGMGMSHDSAMMSSDSTMARDTMTK